jgi:NADH:ubiquinone reductase (H+-translocating)
MPDQEARGGTLIAGGGFAGAYVARLLGDRGSTIVSADNFMLFTPMLPEAASGTLEPRHVVVPIRQMCPHSDLILGQVTAHDPERRGIQVVTEDRVFWIRYTDLVVALGSVVRTPPIPGLAEHALGFKSLGEAIHLRNHILQRLEVAAVAATEAHRRRELTFVFVGAGYAGVEALAELADLVRDALRYYPSLQQEPQHWVLVDAAPKILPEIPTRLGDYAAELLMRRGVDIRVETTLDEVEPHAARLSDGDRLLTSTVVWTAGVRANPLLGELGLPLDERGRVTVDEFLRVEGAEHIWSLGDCAAVPNQTTPGQIDPPTSQHALRQARRLAKNLRGNLRPYRYRMLGEVATLGRYRGIASVFGIPIKGFLGWWITRTYHLYQLPLISRKLRVVTDWNVALFFRRDIAELGTLERPKELGG